MKYGDTQTKLYLWNNLKPIRFQNPKKFRMLNGEKVLYDELDVDHIIPRSHGGKTNWLNVVSACRSCNFKKGNKSLKNSGLKLKVQPYIPSESVLKNNGRLFPPNFLHETWMDFLYWDTELVKN